MTDILVAAEGAAWEQRLLAALQEEPGVRISRRCVDAAELAAVAGAGLGQVALVSCGLRRLDRELLTRLLAARVALVVVTSSEADESRMRQLGVLRCVSQDCAPGELAQVLRTAALAAAQLCSTRDRSDPLSALPASAPSAIASAGGSTGVDPDPGGGPAGQQPPRGEVVAVWGPTGAPGRTTLAVGIAAAAAAGGTRTLLVDADPYGGAVAQVLGLLEEAPGLAAAARAATAGVLDPAGLAVHCRDLLQPSGLLVLPGLLRAERWPELRPSSVAAVLEVARLLAPLVVVDCGFCLEADEELSYDGLAPRRNGVTLEVLAGADQVIAVGSADPLGLQRLLRGLSALSDAVSLRRPAGVVLNRVRPLHGRGSSDAAAREAAGVVRRHLGRDPIGWIPLDQEAMDRAVAVGRTLAEVAPRSPARIALDRLAATVTAAFAPAQRTLRPQVAR